MSARANSAARSVPAASGSVLAGAMRWAELQAPRLLTVSIALWIVVYFAASFYKYETYGQGYDQVDFEQAIWNTLQGRPMEDSRFNFTGSVFGMDWMPMLFFFVPFYGLLPSAHTLFFLQIAGAALGAVPIYWLARDRLGSRFLALAFGLSYLLYPVMLHGVLNPFQVRLFSVTLLLFAFYWFEQGNNKLFWLCAGLAMLARSDVAFVVAMFGIYELLTRRRWLLVLAPLIVGGAYFALSTFVLVPAFAYPGAFAPPARPITDPMACWPCGISPQLAYYGHLGSSGGEILWTVLTQPLNTAALVFTPEKIIYIVSLLLPVLFLSVLGWRPLVLGLPILGLNLLSTREAQYSFEHHYSLLLIPGIYAAAVYGASTLMGRKAITGHVRDEDKAVLASTVKPSALRIPPAAVAMGLVIAGLLLQVPYKNPAVRAFLYPEPPERVAAANAFAGSIPVEAKVAVSSKLAPHLLPRRYIYNFPPAPYSPYNFGTRQREDYVDLDYILVDTSAVALTVDENKIGEKTGLQVLEELADWRLVSEKEKIRLYERVE